MKPLSIISLLLGLNSFAYGPICSGCNKSLCATFEFYEGFEGNEIDVKSVQIHQNITEDKVIFSSDHPGSLFYHRFTGNDNIISNDFSFNQDGVSTGVMELAKEGSKKSNMILKLKIDTKANKRKIKYLIGNQLDENYTVEDFVNIGYFLGLSSFELDIKGLSNNQFQNPIKIKKALCTRQGS